jgi:hypothetical protein
MVLCLALALAGGKGMEGTMGACAIHGFIMVATRLSYRSPARAQNPPKAEVPIGDRLPRRKRILWTLFH